MESNFDLTALLDTHIMGQKRTGRNKQFTLIPIDENGIAGSTIIKGPFKKDAIDRLRRIETMIDQYQLPYFVKSIEVFRQGNEWYVIYPNLLEGRELSWTEHQESFSPYKYRVLNREGLVKLGDIFLDSKEQEWFAEKLAGVTLALIYLYIFGIGDIGLANVLADTELHKIYIIDFIDKRGSVTSTSPFFFLPKEPAKDKAAFWLSQILPSFPIYIEELEGITGLTGEDEERRLNAIRLLQQHQGNSSESPLPQGQTGQMVFKGPFQSTTYSGFKVDVIKSAVQKYIRRNMPEKALMAAFELFRFGELEKGKGIQSNLLNRLAVIAAEDVGPANLNLVIEVIEWVLSDKRDVESLYRYVIELARSPKTRVMSHLYRTYFDPYGLDLAIERGITINEVMSEEDITLLENERLDLWLPKDPEEIKDYLELFIRRLSEGKVEALIWLRYYLQITEIYNQETGKLDKTKYKVASRWRRNNPIVVVWKGLEYLLEERVVNTLREAYFNFSENRPFLMLAVVTALFSLKTSDQVIPSFDLDLDLTIEQLLSGDYLLKLDDFVINVHTREGRKSGKSKRDFANVGAYVTPEDRSFIIDPVYEEIYVTR